MMAKEIIKNIIINNNYFHKKFRMNYKETEDLILCNIKSTFIDALNHMKDSFNNLSLRLNNDSNYSDDDNDDNDEITENDNASASLSQSQSQSQSEPDDYKINDNIRYMIKDVYQEIVEINKEKLQYLIDLPQPVQRTAEWYDIRNNMLTASDLGKIIKENRPGTKNSIVLKKSGNKTDEVKLSGKAITWGVKYEQVANDLYSKRNDIKVYEFGLIQHPTIRHFGASPDGISEDLVMLEIKCPYSREINGKIPEDYYAQIQGQLEVCDLDYCDYLECKIKEYTNYEEFESDIHTNNSNNNEYGSIIEIFNIKENGVKYLYSKLCPTIEEFTIWKTDIVEQIMKDDNLEYNCIYYWKCDIYSCTRVTRDKRWFANIKDKLYSFWEEVLYYRQTGDFFTPQKLKKAPSIKTDSKTKTDYAFTIDIDTAA